MEVRIDLEIGPSSAGYGMAVEESTHGSKPLGKWQTIIACESEHLARARSQSTDSYHDQKDKDNADKAGRTTNALRGVLEDVNERVAGGVTERFSDIADTECIATDGKLL